MGATDALPLDSSRNQRARPPDDVRQLVHEARLELFHVRDHLLFHRWLYTHGYYQADDPKRPATWEGNRW